MGRSADSEKAAVWSIEPSEAGKSVATNAEESRFYLRLEHILRRLRRSRTIECLLLTKIRPRRAGPKNKGSSRKCVPDLSEEDGLGPGGKSPNCDHGCVHPSEQLTATKISFCSMAFFSRTALGLCLRPPPLNDTTPSAFLLDGTRHPLKSPI